MKRRLKRKIKKVIIITVLSLMLVCCPVAASFEQPNYKQLIGYTIVDVGQIIHTKYKIDKKYTYIQLPSGNWYKVERGLCTFQAPSMLDVVILGRMDGNRITLKLINCVDNRICNVCRE